MKHIYATLLLATLALLQTQTVTAQSNALAFDGVDDFVQSSIFSITGASNRTIEAWVKTSGTVTTQQVIVGMGTMPVGTRFTLNILQGKLRIEIGGGGINSNLSIDDGQWHHVAVTFDNSVTNRFKLYVDGVQDASGNITAATVNTAVGSGVAIGRRNDAVNYFDGVIDEVRVWNTVRTAAEIQANINKDLCNTTGLVAYYQFDQGIANGPNSGVTTVADNSGNNNIAGLQNFALTGIASNWTNGVSITNGNTSFTGSASVCASYTMPDGQVYTNSGTYTATIPNAAGCDSVITINLTVNNTTSSLSANTCDVYTAPSGQVYSSTGIYTDTIPNAAGCDSVITIDLTVNAVDTNVAVAGDTLTALQSGGAYQWIDCATNMPIANPTATSSVFVADASGSYAVVVTSPEGCTDTSSCYPVVISNTTSMYRMASIRIHPTPAQGWINITYTDLTAPTTALLFNATGQHLGTYRLTPNSGTNQAKVSVANLPNGVYWLRLVADEGGVLVRPILVQR